MRFNNRDDIIALTPQWKGERFPDGRPKVPDKYLDELRKLTPEALKNDEKMRAGMQKRLVDHPSFRPLAAKVIKQNKLGEFLKVPKTYPELMGSGYRATLNEQAKKLQEIDKKKHPELYTKQPEVKQEVKKNNGPEIGNG